MCRGQKTGNDHRHLPFCPVAFQTFARIAAVAVRTTVRNPEKSVEPEPELTSTLPPAKRVEKLGMAL